MMPRTGEARLACAGASLLAIHTAAEPQVREQTSTSKKPKLGLRMNRAWTGI